MNAEGSKASENVLTCWLTELVNEVLDGVFGAGNNQTTHHVLKDLVETLFLDVLLASTLEVDFLLFQHHI